jgi:uncharacterized DUF497 family protein
MNDLHFTWDPRKEAANLRKHGVSFDEASTLFRNLLATVLPDPMHSRQEGRFLIIGHSAADRLLLVVFTEQVDRIRIISARETSARERREYEEHS